MNSPFLRTIGMLFWIAIVAGSYAATQSPPRSDSQPAFVSLARYVAGPTTRVRVADDSQWLRSGDPVLLQDAGGTWSQIGYVEAASDGPTPQLTLTWYAPNVSPQTCQLLAYHNSGRLEEVVRTMLPPEQRRQIQERLADAMRRHGDELSQAFVPLVQASIRRSIPVIEEEFRLAVQRRRAEIDRLGDRWNDELIDHQLIPLARREIIPIVRTHGEPTAEAIGRELWDRASLWRFGWRAVYDKSPLPRKDLLQQEWDRFVDEEAVPVLEHHMDDIVVAVQRTVTDVAKNQAIRRELALAFDELAADPQTRRLVREILKETLVDNDRLRDVWRGAVSSDQGRAALDLAGQRLEPVIRQIGDDLFGTPEQGINPNFARVLRSQILGKDRRWIVARPSPAPANPSSPPVVRAAGDTMPFPIVYLADRHQAGDEAE